MSNARNNIVVEVAKKAIFNDMTSGVASNLTANQGDLLIFDASTNKIRLPVSEAECVTFLGVSVISLISGHEPNPYPASNDASMAQGALPGPVYGVIASLYLKQGDALDFGDLVYGDPVSGAQNIQASGTKAIGVYQGASITGGSASLVEVLLGARYPADQLKF